MDGTLAGKEIMIIFSDEEVGESSPEDPLTELKEGTIDQEDEGWSNPDIPSITLSQWSQIQFVSIPPSNSPVSREHEDECVTEHEDSPEPYDGPNPMIEKLDQMRERFKNLQGQVSEFQYELEHYEHLRDFAYEDQNLYDLKCLCAGSILNYERKPFMTEMYRELKTILRRPNYKEIEMYADLINKCCAFGSILETWIDSISQPWYDGNAEIIAGTITNTNLLSPRMVWEMDKINIVLERIKAMINCTISEITGVEFEIICQDISQEVEPLAKTFLWLVLVDQKRYETEIEEEFELDEEIYCTSYIDQHPTSLEYCTNIVRCVITEDIQEYLSCHFKHRMGPEIDPQAIRSRGYCSQSRAEKYTVALSQIWTFVEESIVKIDSHEMISHVLPTQAPVFNDEDICEIADRESVSPTQTPVFDDEDICETADTESVSPTQTPVFSFENVTSSTNPDLVCEDTCAEPARDAKEEEEEKRMTVQIFVETLVSRTLRESKGNMSDRDIEAIVMRLFERTWIEVQGVDFNPKTFEQLDTVIFQKLCEESGSAEMVLLSKQSGDPELGNYIASSVKDHLLTPPKKCSTICQFFSSVGRCISNICRCKNRVGVQ